ncbi:MAG: hypothetical protein IKJ65_01515 [Clostridia bacterium]|nr:hypothetical protein [Clostridia bacterium]
MNTILTMDAGTSGLKCSLFDVSGALIKATVSEYPTDYPKDGWAEQKAEDFISAVQSAMKILAGTKGLESVCAIGLTGTMNGLIPIDPDGTPLHPNIIHLDTRATEEVDMLSDVMGAKAFYAITGNRPDVHYGLPKLMWIKKHRPDVYKRAHSFVNTKDILYGYLTGIHARTDYSDASLFGGMNIHTRTWDDDVVKAAGIDKEKLPSLFPSTDISGALCKSAADQLGLKSGIPVSIGAGDGPCSTHGSGVYSENGAYITVGSSAWACGLSKTPVIDPGMRAFNYTDIDESLVNVCGTVQCASTAFDFMMKTVLGITDENGKINFARAEEMAFSSRPGANGVFFLPTLMGERCPWWDANARGMIMGLTLTHTRNDLVRASYEGVAQALNNCTQVLKDNGLDFESLILSGGGVKSNVWPQMFADILGVPAHVHAHPRQATSMGAMIAAGVGAGVYPSFEEAAKTIRIAKTLLPDKEAHKAYKAHTKAYRALYGKSKDAMHESAGYQQLLNQ